MNALRVFSAFAFVCATMAAACVPDGEAEIRGYADRHGVIDAFLKYEREAKGADHSKIMNLYLFLLFYSKELKDKNVPYYLKYDQSFLVYCARYFGEDLRGNDYALPDLKRPNEMDNANCEKTFSTRTLK